MMFSKSNTRKLSILIIILVILTDVSVVVALNSDESIKIMPLGDSITQGTIPPGDPVGYRQKLYLDLTNAGFNVDFVGTLSHGGSVVPPFDSDHEGHSGWHADQIRDNVYGWLVENPADIVLLHIGTNDVSLGDEDVTEVEDILNNVDQYETDHSKDIRVILARIILRTDNFAKNETTKAFNNAVEQMAWDRIANGDDIIIVDMENALTYPDDMADSVHPNAVGYEKMADVWYDAVCACMPIADFTASPTSGPEPLTVSFTDTSTSHNGIMGWTWDFGDGQSSTEQNPTHVYAADGTYTVTLTVLEEDGDDDVKIKMNYITVTDTAPTPPTPPPPPPPPPNKPPTAYFIYSPSHPTDLDTIQFTDQSHDSGGIIASRHWSFGDDSTSSELNPTHRYADDGEYVVTLAVTDDDGATGTMNRQIMVLNVPPKANFTISPLIPTPYDIIQFSDQSSDPDGLIVSWNWDFGDGTTSIDPKPVHKYQNLGTYMINLTVTDDDGATNTVSKSITIYDLTPPDTKNNYDDNWHSKDFTINLTATDDYTGVQGVYYRINDGPIKNVSIDGHPIITTEDANNTLEYWSVDMAGNEENHHILTDIKLDKTSPIANGGGARTVVENIVVNFDASGSFDDFGIVDYEWDFGDGYLGKGLTTAYTYTQPGTYILALTVKDAAGNKNTNSVSITVLKDTDRDVIPDIKDPDDDNDGIPDTWEITHGLNPLEASDAFLDPDGDGLNNFEEYSRGTDLNSYFSPFPLWIIALTVALVVGFALILISIRYTRLLHKKSSYKSEHPKKM